MICFTEGEVIPETGGVSSVIDGHCVLGKQSLHAGACIENPSVTSQLACSFNHGC